jgi:hypothetical protein
MHSLLLWLGLVAPIDCTPMVAVEAAYVLAAPKEQAKPKCCGLCKGGVITHGDGHKSPCPCPETCDCKRSK